MDSLYKFEDFDSAIVDMYELINGDIRLANKVFNLKSSSSSSPCRDFHSLEFSNILTQGF